jgi:hypothetical protein
MDPVTIFLRKFLERLNTEIESRTKNLAGGKGISKIEDYREKVGELRGLVLAAEFCEQARTELMRPDEEQPNPARALPQRVIDRRIRMKDSN